jgi:hypothetical protein
VSPHTHIELEHAMPEIDSGARFRKWVTVLVGIAAATAGVLAFAEAEANRQKEHGLVESARDAQQIFVRLGANTQGLQFSGNATREALAITLQGAARVRSSKPGQPRAFAIAVAQADKQASARLLGVVKQMAAVPAHTPGLDPRTADAVRSSVASAKALLAQQNAAADAANRWATRQEDTIFALGLVAIAVALAGLAGLMGVGRPGRIAAATGSIALLFAIVWSAVTFLT